MALHLSAPARRSRRASAPRTPRTFGDRISRALRWAIVITVTVAPYAGPRLAHAAPLVTTSPIHGARTIGARVSLVASSIVLLSWAILQPRTADLAAQAYRAGLFERVGWVVWDNGWFGGHTVPGYSLLTPWLMANAGIALTGVVAATTTTVAFAAIAGGSRPGWAWPTAWVAWAAAGDLLIGRVTYAVGLALGMLAVLALVRGRHAGVACALAATSAAASPVAGAFLALALAIWWTVGRERAVLMACGCAGAVTVGCALVFGDGGRQPYSIGAAALAVAIALALWLGLARDALLARRALLGYMLVAAACWLLPTPMGSNVARLGVAFAMPVALLARRRVPTGYVALVGVAGSRVARVRPGHRTGQERRGSRHPRRLLPPAPRATRPERSPRLRASRSCRARRAGSPSTSACAIPSRAAGRRSSIARATRCSTGPT